MVDFVNMLNRAGEGFCGFAWGMLVQSSVLIVLLFLVDLLIRKHARAVFRYSIWGLVFVKLVLPPTLCLPTGVGYWCGVDAPAEVAMPERPLSIQQSNPQLPPPASASKIIKQPVEAQLPQMPVEATVKADAPVAVPTVPIETIQPASITPQAVIFLVWLVGVLVLSVLLFQRYLFVKSLLAQTSRAGGNIVEMLRSCHEQIGLGKDIELRLSKNMLSPAACGLLKPVILMPASLLDELSEEKLRAILLHELAHIKRGDLWINFLQTILQIAYFYNPLLWVANSIVRGLREKAVDEMVLTKLGDKADSYSATLLDVAEIAFSKPHFSLRLIGVVESKKALAGRIKHILSRPLPKSAKLGFAGMLAVFIAAAVLLPMAKAKNNTPELSDFKKILYNGVTVEVLGICEHPSKGKQWWKPDGSAYYPTFYTKQRGQVSSSGNPYEIAFKVDGLEDSSFIWGAVKGMTGSSELNVFDSKNNPSDKIEAQRFNIDRTGDTSIKVGVSIGEWKTQFSNYGSSISGINKSGHSINFSKTYKVENGVEVTVTDDFVDMDYRLIAIDKAGKTYISQRHGGSTAGKTRQMTYWFKDIDTENVKEFQFQTRLYEWVEFKNVSLKPDIETNHKIKSKASILLDELTQNTSKETPMQADGFTASLPDSVTLTDGTKKFTMAEDAKEEYTEASDLMKQYMDAVLSSDQATIDSLILKPEEPMPSLTFTFNELDKLRMCQPDGDYSPSSYRTISADDSGKKMVMKMCWFSGGRIKRIDGIRYHLGVLIRQTPDGECKIMLPHWSRVDRELQHVRERLAVELEDTGDFEPFNFGMIGGDSDGAPSAIFIGENKNVNADSDTGSVLYGYKVTVAKQEFLPVAESFVTAISDDELNFQNIKCPGSLEYKLKHISELCDLKDLSIVDIYANDSFGIVRTNGVKRNDGLPYQLGFYFIVYPSGKWVFNDYDWLTNDNAEQYVEKFKENYPDVECLSSVASSNTATNKKTSQREEKASKDNSIEADSFIATLPTGVSVEIVSVSDYPANTVAWASDGSILDDPLFVEPSENGRKENIGFAIKVDGPTDMSLSYKSVEGSRGHSGSEKVINKNGVKLPAYKSLTAMLPEDQEFTSLEFGVSVEPWRIVASHTGKDAFNTRKGIIFSQAFETENFVAITVAVKHDSSNAERVVVIDNAGKVHESQSRGSMTSNDVEQVTVKFYGIKLNNIKEFQFQTRPYEWISFKNVSIKPELKTNVQVETFESLREAVVSEYSPAEMEGSTKETPMQADGFTATLPNGVSIEVLGLRNTLINDKQWWNPDGSLLCDIIPKHKAMPLSPLEGYRDIEAVLKFSGIDVLGTGFKKDISTGLDRASTFPLSPEELNCRGIVFQAPKDCDSTDIKIGITAGKWKDDAYPLTRTGSTWSSSLAVSITWHDAYSDGKNTKFNLTFGSTEVDIRVLAVDHSGKRHPNINRKESVSKAFGNYLFVFDVPLDEIKSFVLQVREYQWIEFKNVAIKSTEIADSATASNAFLIERRDILKKKVNTLKMLANDGRANTCDITLAKIELLRVESELA